jgi:hypothetical protein
MNNFGGFLFIFILFIFAIKWALVKQAGGELFFRRFSDGGYGNYGRRRHGFISGDDSFINKDHGLTSKSSFRNHDINPANGLPMVDGIGSVDVMGNPYGIDSHDLMGAT